MVVKKKHCLCKPGSVPMMLLVSVIYLLRTSPCVSSVLPSIASLAAPRAGNPDMSMVYMNLQPPAGTARRSPVGWWSLTPPSHPYPCGRSFSSSLTSCRQLLLLSEVECPVLPGLSSRLSFQKRQRQTETVHLDLRFLLVASLCKSVPLGRATNLRFTDLRFTIYGFTIYYLFFSRQIQIPGGSGCRSPRTCGGH